MGVIKLFVSTNLLAYLEGRYVCFWCRPQNKLALSITAHMAYLIIFIK